jgi:pyruvate/2-oxoglutarate dehydrogenase complex dihydrolipoamide dehydrogenase (E3) component
MPSKNEIWSAKVVDLLHHAAQFGAGPGNFKVDMTQVLRRKREMVDDLVAIHLDHYKASGTELIMGSGRFVAANTLEVRLNDGGIRVLTGDRFFLNLGTHATLPPIPGLAEAEPLTHIEILEVDRLPAHLIVLGGGYVGLEFAQAYRRFGSRVTVVQRGPQVLVSEDADVANELQRILAGEDIEILLGTEALDVEGRSGQGVRVRVRSAAGESRIEGTDLFVATGRTPNTRAIGLNEAGVQLDDRGYIRVDERLQTTAPGVWAIGECAGTPHFTHASVDDFRIIRDNLAGGARTTRDRLVPYCLFTDPPLARVGLTEREARNRGIAVRIARLPMANVLRTHTTGESRGFMKAIVEAEGRRILGFAMLGADAGEVLAAVQTAMLGRLPYTLLREAIITHPTMAEGLNDLFAAIPAL